MELHIESAYIVRQKYLVARKACIVMRNSFTREFAFDRSVHHNVGDMNALRSQLPRERARNRP